MILSKNLLFQIFVHMLYSASHKSKRKICPKQVILSKNLLCQIIVQLVSPPKKSLSKISDFIQKLILSNILPHVVSFSPFQIMWIIFQIMSTLNRYCIMRTGIFHIFVFQGDDRVQQNPNGLQRTMQVENTTATRNK